MSHGDIPPVEPEHASLEVQPIAEQRLDALVGGLVEHYASHYPTYCENGYLPISSSPWESDDPLGAEINPFDAAQVPNLTADQRVTRLTEALIEISASDSRVGYQLTPDEVTRLESVLACPPLEQAAKLALIAPWASGLEQLTPNRLLRLLEADLPTLAMAQRGALANQNPNLSPAQKLGVSVVIANFSNRQPHGDSESYMRTAQATMDALARSLDVTLSAQTLFDRYCKDLHHTETPGIDPA
jgi:hypothetical protein